MKYFQAALVVLGAILLIVISSPIDWGVLRFVALLPLLFIFSLKLSKKREAFLVWATGLLYLLWSYSSILHLFPLDWLGVEGTVLGILIVFLLWVVFSVFLSISIFALLVTRFSILLFPIGWVLSEYIRSWLYSLIVLGGSSTLGDHFSFGFLGYTAHTSESLLSLAPYIGVYGLSFLIALLNLFLFFLIFKMNNKEMGKILAALFFGIFIVSDFFVLTPQKEIIQGVGRDVRVVAVQNNNPVRFSYDTEHYEEVALANERIIKEALEIYPDTELIVLSENSRVVETLHELRNATIAQTTNTLLGGNNRVLVEGLYDEDRNVSLSVFYTEDTPEPSFIEKDLLMPFGEYQPHIIKGFATLIGKGAWVDQVESQKNTQQSGQDIKTLPTHLGNISAIACSEILSFPVYGQVEEEDPDIIIHQQRLAHFHGNTKIFEQILAVAKIRAAVLGKYVVGSVDSSGYSHIIDPRGKVIEIGDPDTTFVTHVISI